MGMRISGISKRGDTGEGTKEERTRVTFYKGENICGRVPLVTFGNCSLLSVMCQNYRVLNQILFKV